MATRTTRATVITATASPLQRRVPRDNKPAASQPVPLIKAATTTFEPRVAQPRPYEQEECCAADLWDAGLCEVLFLGCMICS